MARTIYGGTSADYATAPGGRIVPGATFEAYDAKTGGSRITDLLDADGNPTTLVTASSTGLIYYSGPDGDKDPHWLQPTAGGERTAVVPLDNVGETGLTPSLSITPVTTGTAAATLTGTDEEPVLSLVLPSAGANGVNTAAIQDSAVTSAKIADSAVTSAKIADGTIVDADISATAAIAVSKVAGAYGAKTANYTITSADSVVAADTTSGAVTLTLPAASGMTGKAIRIVKTAGANTLTISRAGSDTISPSSGSRTSVAFPSGTHGEMVLVSSGTSWHVVSGQASDESVGRRLWKFEQALAASSTTAGVGWQLIHADTGQRDMRAVTMENGWTVAGTDMRLRRIGNMVTFRGTPDAAAATSDTFYTLPSGFRPASSAIFGTATVATTAGATRLLEIGSNGVCKIYSRSTGAQWFSATFDTNDAWPTSLPGSASGTIPTGA